MKNFGIVRKIDELGRIVIPKEIRNKLNINEYDEFEMYIENNKIVLDKFSTLNYFKNKINSTLDSLRDIIETDVFISDKENIISKGELEGKKLPSKLKEYLHSLSTENDNIQKDYFNKTGYYYITPIIKESNLIGLLILYKKTKINENDIFLAKILKKVFANG